AAVPSDLAVLPNQAFTRPHDRTESGEVTFARVGRCNWPHDLRECRCERRAWIEPRAQELPHVCQGRTHGTAGTERRCINAPSVAHCILLEPDECVVVNASVTVVDISAALHAKRAKRRCSRKVPQSVLDRFASAIATRAGPRLLYS